MKRTARRVTRWDVVEKGFRKFPKYRVAWCGFRPAKVYWGAPSVSLVRQGDRAWYSGLYTCGDVWLCPDCAAKISRRRRTELAEAVVSAGGQNLAASMVTYTFPHGWTDDLAQTMEKFSKARQKLRSQRAWVNFKARWGVVGEIKALEVTHGSHGWHPHLHVAVFSTPVPEDQRPEYEAELYQLWRSACCKADLPDPSEEHGVHVSWFEDPQKLDLAYIAKWSAIQELTGSQSKQGKRHGRSPWQLLEDAGGGCMDPQRAAQLWHEYAGVFHGRRQLSWSKGLRERLHLPKLFDDADLVIDPPAESPDQLVVVFSEQQWVAITRAQAELHLLELAEHENSEVVRAAANDVLARTLLFNGAMAPLLE